METSVGQLDLQQNKIYVTSIDDQISLDNIIQSPSSCSLQSWLHTGDVVYSTVNASSNIARVNVCEPQSTTSLPSHVLDVNVDQSIPVVVHRGHDYEPSATSTLTPTTSDSFQLTTDANTQGTRIREVRALRPVTRRRLRREEPLPAVSSFSTATYAPRPRLTSVLITPSPTLPSPRNIQPSPQFVINNSTASSAPHRHSSIIHPSISSSTIVPSLHSSSKLSSSMPSSTLHPLSPSINLPPRITSPSLTSQLQYSTLNRAFLSSSPVQRPSSCTPSSTPRIPHTPSSTLPPAPPLTSHKHLKFVCDTCDRRFSQKSALRSHLLSHEDRGYLPCPLCNETFVNEKVLSIHAQQHYKPADCPLYPCHLCESCFSLECNLMTHMKQRHSCPPKKKPKDNVVTFDPYHDLRYAEVSSLKSHECMECPRIFTNKHELKLHMHTMHMSIRLIGEEMEKHAMQSDNLFVCIECKLAFVRRCVYECHARLHTRPVKLPASTGAGASLSYDCDGPNEPGEHSELSSLSSASYPSSSTSSFPSTSLYPSSSSFISSSNCTSSYPSSSSISSYIYSSSTSTTSASFTSSFSTTPSASTIICESTLQPTSKSTIDTLVHSEVSGVVNYVVTPYADVIASSYVVPTTITVNKATGQDRTSNIRGSNDYDGSFGHAVTQGVVSEERSSDFTDNIASSTEMGTTAALVLRDISPGVYSSAVTAIVVSSGEEGGGGGGRGNTIYAASSIADQTAPLLTNDRLASSTPHDEISNALCTDETTHPSLSSISSSSSTLVVVPSPLHQRVHSEINIPIAVESIPPSLSSISSSSSSQAVAPPPLQQRIYNTKIDEDKGHPPVDSPFIHCTECNLCSKQFNSHNKLKIHREREHPTFDFSCQKCHKKFPNQRSLSKHIRYMHPPQGVKCKECDQVFSTIDQCREHKMSAHSLKFQCIYCKLVLKTMSSLKRHHIIHSDQKPFICNVCSRAFRSKSTLDSHKGTHLDVKPFNCSICVLGFVTASAHRKHMRRHNDPACPTTSPAHPTTSHALFESEPASGHLDDPGGRMSTKEKGGKGDTKSDNEIKLDQDIRAHIQIVKTIQNNQIFMKKITP